MAIKIKDIIANLDGVEVSVQPQRCYSNGRVEGNTVKIEVNGLEICGELTYRGKQSLRLSIRSPYDGLSASSGYIPLFALPYYDMMGKEGDVRAMNILFRLYKSCIYIEEHLLELQKCLQTYDELYVYQRDEDETRKKGALLLEEVIQQKSSLKKALKAGELNNKDYQKQVKPIKKQISQFGGMAGIDTELIFVKAFHRYHGTPVFDLGRLEAIQLIKNLSQIEKANNKQE